MKVVAVILTIGFLLLTGIPLVGSGKLKDGDRPCCCKGSGGRMTCQMNSPMHSCSCATHSAQPRFPSQQSCNGACSAVPVQTSGIFSRIRRYSVEGYRRISGKNILDHKARSLIYECIVQTPGIDLKTLVMKSGLNENTTRYHLEMMQKVSKVLVTTIGGISHYFENHGKYSEEEQILSARMFSSSSNRLLQLIVAQPGICGERADRIGISGPSVTRGIGASPQCWPYSDQERREVHTILSRTELDQRKEL